MSWQDDLRQLDQALAEGRISADGYRQRRDQILASYASGGAEVVPPHQSGPLPQVPPPGTPPGGEVQQQPSQNQPPHQQQQPPQQGGPFAPPFRWTSTSPEATQAVGGSADATQVVSGNSMDDSGATQVVGTNTGQGEATQSFRPVGGPPPGQFPPPRPPQWDPHPDNSPPWGSDTGGLNAPNPTWLVQGPEVFQSGGRSNKARIIAIVVAVIVVLGLAAGAFFLFGNKSGGGGGGPTTQQTTSTPPPTTTPPPPDDLAIANLPGNHEDHGDIHSFSDAINDSQFLTPDEVKFYRTAGAGNARLATSATANSVHVLVFTTEASSPTAAATAVDGLSQQQLIYGFQSYSNPPAGVQVAQVDRTSKVPATIRAHYVHDGTVVRIQVNGNDLTSVTTVFQQVIQAQLNLLPADG
ncbi:MAG TPA: hypothetical protein VHV74_05010 [Pseudonocardiaceae bacterium]|jgi:hypothetical protein|nr:hypothetical protein [Pseudonocardiaceae bacterium]